MWKKKGRHHKTEQPRCMLCILAGFDYALHPGHPHRLIPSKPDAGRCECWCARV